MSIKAMKLALEALENASPAAWASRVDSDTMKSIWRKHADALEGLQVLLAELDNASRKSVQKRLEAQQPDTGEPFGYIHHFAAHDERGVLIDTTWEADGCADPLPHPTFPSMWKWTHCTPFYTTPQTAQATQATDYVGVEPDGIVIGFHEGNALVDHAGNLEEGNCLFLSPAIPTQTTQAELTDAAIDAATRHIYHNGRPTSKEYRVGIARAILALRPERAPMTGDQWTDVLGSAGPDMLDLAKQWADNKVHVYQVVNQAEKIVKAAVLRGIAAQAKKETP